MSGDSCDCCGENTGEWGSFLCDVCADTSSHCVHDERHRSMRESAARVAEAMKSYKGPPGNMTSILKHLYPMRKTR